MRVRVRSVLGVLAAAAAWGIVPGAVSAQTDAQTKAGEMLEEAAPDKDRELEVGRWYPDLVIGLTANQTHASDNWYGGDVSSWSWVSFLYGAAENQIKSQVNWYTELKLAYGQTAKQVKNDDGTRSWESPQKTQDQIFTETLFRFTLGAFVDPFVSAGFQSQFLDATDPSGRTLQFNPLLFWQQAGVARKFIDHEKTQFVSRLGFSFREFTRRQFTDPYPSETTVSESGVDGGLSWTSDLKTQIVGDRVAWTSKLTVYQAAFWSGKDDLESVPDQLEAAGIDRNAADFVFVPDVDWENVLVNQVSKVLSVDLYVRFRYDKYDNTILPILDETGMLQNAVEIDKAIRKKGQIKEALGIGISYRFF